MLKTTIMKISQRVLIVIFFVSLVVIAALSLVGILLTHTAPVRIQGTIEAPEVRISGKLAGRVERILVREGEAVHKGDTLITIHSPEVEAERTQAQAVEGATRAQSRKVEGGTRPEIVAAAREGWVAAKSQRTLAEKSYKRLKRLHADSVVSLQRMEEAEALYQSAKAAESAAHEQYLLARRGAQSEDKESAELMAVAAGGVVEAVEALLGDSHLLSPTDGIVADIYPEVGELVGTGAPLLTITDLSAPYLILNVREDYMPNFRLGGRFMGSVPAIGGEEVEWEIFYIAPMGDFATWHTSNPRSGYNMRSFEIHARPTTLIDGLLAGMSVITKLDTKSR